MSIQQLTKNFLNNINTNNKQKKSNNNTNSNYLIQLEVNQLEADDTKPW